ncbi:hypothetical protein (Partial), partial [Seminavis robusta]
VVDRINQIIAADTENESISLVREHLKLQVFDSGPVFPKGSSVLTAVDEGISNPIAKNVLKVCVSSADSIGLLSGGESSKGTKFWRRMKETRLESCRPAQAYVYSLEDNICDIDDLKDLISYRKELSPCSRISVLEFKTGVHCNLLREHESMYCEFVKGLVKNIQMAS